MTITPPKRCEVRFAHSGHEISSLGNATASSSLSGVPDPLETHRTEKVLIVGAGAAGLSAGFLLERESVDFEILEASSRYGGRVRKVEGFADFPIDLGAEWIHKWIGAKPPFFKQLLAGKDRRFRTFPDKPQTHSVWKGGKLRERNWLRFVPLPTDLKFTDSTWFDALNTLATPGVLKKIHFNDPVASIDYRNSEVVVTTDSGLTYVGDAVLVTVPIAMLHRETIRFEPPLPAYKQAEIKKEKMPGGLKVFIEFSRRFYPDFVHIGEPLRLDLMNECSYYDATAGKHSDRHVLGLFTQGARAERYTAHQTDDELFKYVLAELDDIFDGQASQHYVKHIVQDWTREPFIQGSYSQRKASAKELAKPVAGRVFFAGEAMNPSGKTIAVHGACESACSAVSDMLTRHSKQ